VRSDRGYHLISPEHKAGGAALKAFGAWLQVQVSSYREPSEVATGLSIIVDGDDRAHKRRLSVQTKAVLVGPTCAA